MKRNTLMKRMAIAALVATMSVGMAVPAMAAPSAAGTGSSSNGQTGISFGVQNNDDDDITGYSWNVLRRSTFDDDYKITLDSLGDDDHEHGSGVVATLATPEVGNVVTTTSAATVAKDVVTKGTLKPSITYDVKYVGDDRNASYKVDGDELTITPNKWGTTFIKISETFHYFALSNADGTKLYDNDKLGKAGTNTSTWNPTDGYTGGSSDNLRETMKKYKDGFTLTGNQKAKAFSTTYTWYVAYDTPFNTTTLDQVIKKAKVKKASTQTEAANNVHTAVADVIKEYEPKQTSFNTSLTRMWDVNDDIDVDTIVVSKTDISDDDKVTATLTVGPEEEDAVNWIYDKSYDFDYYDDSDLPYDDVTTSNYYYDQVKEALEDGAFEADSDSHFGASDTITRADFVYAMWKKEGAPKGNYDNLFQDISGLDQDHQRAISWAVQNHIVSGYTDTAFRPNAVLNRAAVVQMLYKQSKKSVDATDSVFSDVPSTKWYAEAVKWGSRDGRVAGYKDGTFRPYNNVTKAQAAAFLYR